MSHNVATMKFDGTRVLSSVLFAGFLSLSSQAQPGITQVTQPKLWQRLEFSITNVPAATNPFDPDIVSVDGRFTLPSGRSMVVPAFWHQD